MLCVADLFREPVLATSQGRYWIDTADLALTTEGLVWVAVDALLEVADTDCDERVCLVNEKGYLSIQMPTGNIYPLWDQAAYDHRWLQVDTWKHPTFQTS